MSNNANKNQGVQIIADFTDRAVPLNAHADVNYSRKASRSANEEIHPFAHFENDVQRLNGSGTNTLETLNTLLAQHEQNVQTLVKKLQGMIEELTKENADLKGVLMEDNRLVNRYYLDGPSEDEI